MHDDESRKQKPVCNKNAPKAEAFGELVTHDGMAGMGRSQIGGISDGRRISPPHH
jgi:hypothetical protein